MGTKFAYHGATSFSSVKSMAKVAALGVLLVNPIFGGCKKAPSKDERKATAMLVAEREAAEAEKAIEAKKKSGQLIVTLLVPRVTDVSLETVKRLIAEGKVDERDRDGRTALMNVAFGGHKAIAEVLVANGADVNAEGRDGTTALMIAVLDGNNEITEYLIANGAKVNVADSSGKTVLMMAVRSGRPQIVGLVIENGADVNAKDKRDETALMIAAGNYEIARLLVAKGADVDAKDRSGRTALMGAAWSRTDKVIELLIAKGADVNARDNNGETALIKVMLTLKQYGRWYSHSTAKLLIAKGADVNATDKDGKTALELAVENGHPQLADMLRAHGAKEQETSDRTTTAKPPAVGLDAVDRSGFTELMTACLKGDEQLARSLIEKGADVNARVKNGPTALMYAARQGETETVKLLIKKGADVNAKDIEGTVLMQTMSAVDIAKAKEIVETLIAHGADVNARAHVIANNPETALMAAVDWRRVELARILIAKGAGIDARDSRGETALMRAASEGQWWEGVAELLLAKGAEVDAMDERGETALMKAVEAGERDTTWLLVANGHADVNAMDGWGETALMKAARRELWREAYAELSMANMANEHADANAKACISGGTTIDIATYKGNGAIVDILCAGGANVNARNGKGETALMMAVVQRKAETARHLIRNGADVDARDGKGETALVEAVRRNNMEIAEILIAKGADVNARDKDGNTLLKLAVGNVYRAGIADMLRKHGAKE